MWGSTELWSWLNQFGVICTLLGTVLTAFTFTYVRKVRSILIIKNRLPTVHGDIVKLLPEYRNKLRDWDNSKEEAMHMLYELKGHINNIRPSLGDKEKVLADVLVGHMSFDTKWYSSIRREMTQDDGWYVSRLMTEFEVMLNGLHKDNEASRL
ncbi:hypothetical protein GV729_09275 [Pseudomonas sp. Fl4BN2]|nr:hypothetical protein [Pseudomonas sp. Fl4BN2]